MRKKAWKERRAVNLELVHLMNGCRVVATVRDAEWVEDADAYLGTDEAGAWWWMWDVMEDTDSGVAYADSYWRGDGARPQVVRTDAGILLRLRRPMC